MTKFYQSFILNHASSKLNNEVKMLIEELLFEIAYKHDGLKYINNYIIEEIEENCCYKDEKWEFHNKIMSLLHTNSTLIESLENLTSSYQKQVNEHYKELLCTEA